MEGVTSMEVGGGITATEEGNMTQKLKWYNVLSKHKHKHNTYVQHCSTSSVLAQVEQVAIMFEPSTLQIDEAALVNNLQGEKLPARRKTEFSDC
jgi:hypothetical protein